MHHFMAEDIDENTWPLRISYVQADLAVPQFKCAFPEIEKQYMYTCIWWAQRPSVIKLLWHSLITSSLLYCNDHNAVHQQANFFTHIDVERDKDINARARAHTHTHTHKEQTRPACTYDSLIKGVDTCNYVVYKDPAVSVRKSQDCGNIQ
jgi:hypothetical protein